MRLIDALLEREGTRTMGDDTETVNADAVKGSDFEDGKAEAVSELGAILAPITEVANDFCRLLAALADSSESYAVRSVAKELLERYATEEEEASSDASDTVAETV